MVRVGCHVSRVLVVKHQVTVFGDEQQSTRDRLAYIMRRGGRGAIVALADLLSNSSSPEQAHRQAKNVVAGNRFSSCFCLLGLLKLAFEASLRLRQISRHEVNCSCVRVGHRQLPRRIIRRCLETTYRTHAVEAVQNTKKQGTAFQSTKISTLRTCPLSHKSGNLCTFNCSRMHTIPIIL